MNIKLNFICICLIYFTNSISQNFDNLRGKEEYDVFNKEIENGVSICNSPSEDNLAETIPYTLDSYITMYKTTRDKAYLYKFILQTLCLMETRYSRSPGDYQYIWSTNDYINGRIIGSLARFVYLIKSEEPWLRNELIYPFQEYSHFPFRDPKWGSYPTPQGPVSFVFGYPDPTPQGFNTFFLFADWLAYRVDQTLDDYIGRGQFNLYYGVLRNSLDYYEMNKQVGFGRAAMYQGLTDPNTSAYTPRGRNIASDYFNQINFYDNCTNQAYNHFVLRENTLNNSYWWYHQGWGSFTRNCSNHQNVIDYNHYVLNVEDISHGSIDVNFAHEYYSMQPQLIQKFVNKPPAYYSAGYFDVFYDWQMTRFKNTFTKNLYDNAGGVNNINGAGGFNNATDGADGVITQGSKPHNYFALISMTYMPLEVYDDGDGSSVYQILMNYYKSNISNLTIKPSEYGGLANKGHADVVAAQWQYQCTNLELYNRNVVYNQDFFAKNRLVITPETSNLQGGISYAEPLISMKEFIVPNAVTVNMTAGESVTLKPGVQIKAGSTFRAYINPNSCTNDGMRMSSGNSSTGKNSSLDSPAANFTNEKTKQITNKVVQLRAVPNPFTNSTTIQFSLNKESKVNLKLIDAYGRMVFESKEDKIYSSGFNEVVIATESLAQGLYNCILNINNEEIQTINIVKQ